MVPVRPYSKTTSTSPESPQMTNKRNGSRGCESPEEKKHDSTRTDRTLLIIASATGQYSVHASLRRPQLVRFPGCGRRPREFNTRRVLLFWRKLLHVVREIAALWGFVLAQGRP